MHPYLLQQLNRACTLHPSLSFTALQSALAQKIPHGDFAAWLQAIDALCFDVEQQVISEVPTVRGQAEQSALLAVLHALKPWRKGHFELFGLDVDGEWRSELKYARLQQMGLNLQGKRVLDVGCGNGYYLMRMLGDGAKCVLGIDPSFHYLAQYALLSRCFNLEQSALLPLTLDDGEFSDFDVTLSMGVLYHRKDPILHLKQLATTLAENGELVLETLILPDDGDTVLVPAERYAGMRNVYAIPSSKRLQAWLSEAGFEVLAISQPCATTSAEQRKTAWIDSYSLDSFLTPDQTQTIEGYPPPLRQIIIAKRFG